MSGGRGSGRGNHAGRSSNNYGAPGRGRGTNNYSGGRGGRGRDGGRGGRNHPPNNQNNTNTINPDDPFEVPYGYLPAYLPGAASMVEQLDRRLLVILRDGRHLVGVLRTFDQFSNMVLQDTCERRILVVQKDKKSEDDNNTTAAGGTQPSTSSTICYQTDIELGLFVVRGDNVVLLGEAEDDNEEEEGNGQIRLVSLDVFEHLEDEEARRKEESGTVEEEPINWDFDMDLVA